MEEILKYIDIFGTKSYFFTNKEKKFYTLYGGILSIVSIFILFSIFVFLAKDDIQRKFPSTSFISEYQQKNNGIKSIEEKIWIPWRIVSDKDFLNYAQFLYPVISYNIEENNSTKAFKLRTEKINFRLCNETSLINLLDLIYINAPLNELYCIDSENLKPNDNYKNSKINHIKFDFYLCKNGFDYNDNNPGCINKQRIIDIEDSLKLELYYPKTHHNPTNKKKPFSLKYNQLIYNFFRYTHRTDNIYLQKQILIDDQGWFIKSVKNYAYWSVNKIDEKIYDDTNESINSNVYTINFYFDNIITQYYRSYKKILTIISEIFPIIFILYSFIQKLAKILKSTEQNKILNELLFENLVGRISKFTNFLNQVRMSNGELSQVPDINNKSELAELQNRKCSLFNKNNQSNNNDLGKSSNNIIGDINHKIENHDNILNANNNDNSKEIIFNNKKDENHLKLESQRANCYSNKKVPISGKDCIPKDINIQMNKINQNKNSLNKGKNKNYEQSSTSQEYKRYDSIKLFPYKYYFFLIFCKTLDANKKKLFMEKKFIKANLFINQLMDVSSYIILQREFQVLKKKFLTKEKIKFVEKNKKININNKNFLREVNECLEQHKFNILANSV